MITLDALICICPSALPTWVPALNSAADRFGIDTPERVAMWLAQIAHESAGLTRLVENLNYSAAGLMATWPTRFTDDATASVYARQPERIANHVYASRMGNGPEASGDGWTYRGRGPIQITGRDNYRSCGEAIGLPLEDDPDLLLQPGPGALSAGWFWDARQLNGMADRGDMEGCTRRINGGRNGLDDRTRLWVKISRAMGVA